MAALNVVPLSSVSSVVKGLLPIRQRRIYVAEQDKEEAERIVSKSLKGGSKWRLSLLRSGISTD